jgi:hypothetical protein
MNYTTTRGSLTRTGLLAIGGLLAALLMACDPRQGEVASYDDCVLSHSKGLSDPRVLDTIKVSCKQKYPKTFDFDAIAKAANVPSWSEVAGKDKYRAFDDKNRESVRESYFLEIVSPRVHPDFIAEARTQFDSFARGIDKQLASRPLPNSQSKDASSGMRAPTQSTPPLTARPLPANGQVSRCASRERIAPLSIVTRDSERHFFVKLEDWNNGQSICGIFVRAGESAEVEVPLGSFRLKYATGTEWFGDETLFGPETTYHQADRRFDFSREDGKVRGYTVELFLQAHGNLKTSRIDKSNW